MTLTKTESDAINDSGEIETAFENTIPFGPQTLWAKLERSDGCASISSIVNFTVTVLPPPEINTPEDIALCDDTTPGDGIEVFDLTTKTGEITGGNADYIVTYYENQADAEGGINAIAAPGTYANTTPWLQEVFARVETPEGCFDTTVFNLVVNPLPGIVMVTDYPECETEVGTGLATFDLTSQDSGITNNNAQYIVEYYTSSGAAQSGDPAGLADSPYTTATTTLYVRVTDTDTGCVNYGELNLEVVPVPVPGVATPLEVCENDPSLNNLYIGTFDLTPAINEVVNGQSGLTVTVHEREADAIAGINAIADPAAYTNTNSDPADPADGNQTIFINITRTGTECFAVAPVTVIVHPIPAIGELTPYELSDYTNSHDGV